jgi:GNAT superfamily N-acetyltransferase
MRLGRGAWADRRRRDWRRRGVAAFLRRHVLHWAAVHGLAEVSTWTQRDNHAMRRLNETLGYTYGQQSITVTPAIAHLTTARRLLPGLPRYRSQPAALDAPDLPFWRSAN